MELDDKVDLRVQHILDKLQAKDELYITDTYDLLVWGHYGQDVFSQFGYGVYSWTFRQRNGSHQLVIKATEESIPLVAFVTSATTIGCVQKALDLLYKGGLKWQKDRFPSI
jgi:hypothetical protein